MAVRKYTLAVYFAIFFILQVSDAAIEPVDETYNATLSTDFTIPWTFDNEADMDTVLWAYKSSSTALPTTIVSKAGTAAAQVFNSYNVEHVGNGNINLKTVTMDNAGIYYCTVAYTLFSGLPGVTGTATLSVTAAPAGGGNPCKAGCIAGSTLGGTVFIGLVVGIIVCLYKKYGGKVCEKPREEKPKHETQSGNPRTGQKSSEKEKKISKEAEAHIKNKQHDQGKKQPTIPEGAPGTELHGREDSDRAVSRQQVELEESGHSLAKRASRNTGEITVTEITDKAAQVISWLEERETIVRHARPMPDIPKVKGSKGHESKDGKGRGLSAYFDDDHPLVVIETPSQKAGTLNKIKEDKW